VVLILSDVCLNCVHVCRCRVASKVTRDGLKDKGWMSNRGRDHRRPDLPGSIQPPALDTADPSLGRI
jgi:hypothetical protein